MPTNPSKLTTAPLAPIRAATEALASGGTLRAWEAAMRKAVTTAHTAAYLAAIRDRTGVMPQTADALPEAERSTLRDLIDRQLDYLAGFVKDLLASKLSPAQALGRALMYGRAAHGTYWSARTRGLPLPAMPGEGTQCMANCRCTWEVQTLDGDGNHDAYWRMGAAEHCQTCTQRAATWAPVRIRGGVLQL
jgi:hypothetical protein